MGEDVIDQTAKMFTNVTLWRMYAYTLFLRVHYHQDPEISIKKICYT